MAARLLIIEDDPEIAQHEKVYLEKLGGYTVDLAEDGLQGMEAFNKQSYDLIVLDLMLPGESGEDLLKEIRAKSDVPIIIVSARALEEDRVQNLTNGADDYLTKPFSPKELVVRAQAILRRTYKSHGDKPRYESSDGRVSLDLNDFRILKDQEEVHMTKNEFLIFQTLLAKPEKTFTRDEIIEIVFGSEYDGYDRAVDTHIKNIRQKIEDDPKAPVYIETIYGVGYRAGDFHELS